MNPVLRKILVRTMPRCVLQTLRCWHAPRVAKRYSDADWPPAPAIRSLIKSGDTVLDVGANMGYLTARLAEYVGPSGRVYAIEPVPDTYALLDRTVRKLALTQVTPVHACASNQSGTVAMEIPHYADGTENLYEAHVVSACEVKKIRRRVRVRAVTLDEIADAEKSPVRFIKMDVEGHEGAALEGARSLLERWHPALFIEISGDPDVADSPAAGVFAFLEGMGYQAFRWDGHILKPRGIGDFSVDYFFLQPSHLARVSDWIPTSGRISDLGQCSQEPR